MKPVIVKSVLALGIAVAASAFFSVTTARQDLNNVGATQIPTTITTGALVNNESVLSSTDVSLDIVGFNAGEFTKPSDAVLKKTLSAIEYEVTQKDRTERAFSNPMHEEKRPGLYVDIVSGEPLFASSDKFDSRTGWPSFTQPIAAGVVIEKEDRSLFGLRTEIRSTVADSHLGHVFNDGPAPTGNRYCMNAAAMRFIPLEQMADEGYAAYIDRVVDGSPGA